MLQFILYVDEVVDERIEESHVVEKMDSGASANMSGSKDRLVQELPLDDTVKIVGFNGTMSSPQQLGLNRDGKREYYVPSMPENMALLSAHSYAQDGAVVLFEVGGAVLQLSSSERNAFQYDLLKYKKVKNLCVNNRTYEVCQSNDTVKYDKNEFTTAEEANSNTAVRFFNNKVNVSNKCERILTMLMTGLSFRDIYMHVQNNSLEGIPSDLSISALNRFEHQYGRTPEIIQLATARNPGHHHGLMDQRQPLQCCGERYEIDIMEADSVYGPPTRSSSAEQKTKEGCILWGCCCWSSRDRLLLWIFTW